MAKTARIIVAFNHRTVVFVVVESFNLRVTLSNKPSLVMFYSAVFIEFDFEYPFGPNYIGIRWSGNQLPSVIFIECLNLLVHGIFPMR